MMINIRTLHILETVITAINLFIPIPIPIRYPSLDIYYHSSGLL